MAREESIEKTKDLIKEVITKMGVDCDIEIREQAETTVFNIKATDSNILIGQYGVNLAALQYICRIVVRRKVDESFDFIIDVDGYKKKREAHLSNLAKQAYKEAVNQNRPVIIKPMPAYERRAIHATLSEYTDVSTDSIGEDPSRMVVVRPNGLEEISELDETPLFGPDQDYKVL